MLSSSIAQTGAGRNKARDNHEQRSSKSIFNSLSETTIYTSYGTEFTFNDEGLCVALKLNGRTATKEDIIAESEKIEQLIRQDQAKVLNNNL